MLSLHFDGPVASLRKVMLSGFAFVALCYICISIHWSLMSDSPVMHYVAFLLHHGLKPYQDISDNNLPGSYLTELGAMSVFGGTDLGWRIYEFFLLGALTLAMAVIARTVDWTAGVYAAGVFLLVHAAEGPGYAVEREQVLTLLLMVAYASLFEALRRRRPALLLPFGVCVGLAGSIKPTMAPLCVPLLLMVGYVLRKRRWPVMPYLLWAVAGMAVVALFELGFLLRYHAVHDALFVLRKITPAYVSMNNPRWGDLLRRVFPKALLVLVPFGMAALLLNVLNRKWDWERWALAVGAGFGLLSYFAQRKGFLHHRYMFLTCVLLLLGLEIMSSLKRPGWPRWTAVAAVAVTLLVLAPRYLWMSHEQPRSSEFTVSLESDLRQMGGDKLQRQVECFDLVYGCLNALYHLNLVENTGFTGDLLLFAPKDGFARDFYRREFWEREQQKPAAVLVVSNEWFGMPNSFGKLNAWPEFVRYLEANYTAVLARSFPREAGDVSRLTEHSKEPDAYRIYVRNGSPLLEVAARATLPAGM